MEPRDAYRKINLLRWRGPLLPVHDEPAVLHEQQRTSPIFYKYPMLRAMYLHVQQIEYHIR